MPVPYHPLTPESEAETYQERLARDGSAPLPSCPQCHGCGFLHPVTKDGRAIYSRVVICDCYRKSKEDYRAGKSYLSQIGVSNINQTFNSFKQLLGTEKTYAAFYNLAFGEITQPLLLVMGTPGNGKTHLCNSLAQELSRKSVVRLYTAADMFSMFKEAMNDNKLEQQKAFIKTVQVLLIDDWGVNLNTEWARGILDEIIDYRYRNEMITVLTTNLDPGVLSQRLISRFSDSNKAVTVVNEGADQRS